MREVKWIPQPDGSVLVEGLSIEEMEYLASSSPYSIDEDVSRPPECFEEPKIVKWIPQPDGSVLVEGLSIDEMEYLASSSPYSVNDDLSDPPEEFL